MKSKFNQHITFAEKSSIWKTGVRPIISCVTAALSMLAAQSAYAQFAHSPLYLQSSSTTTSATGTKPKVMLLIDNSGSMEWIPGANRTPSSSREKSRLDITKSALTTVVNQYKDSVNWGIQTLNDNDKAGQSGYTTSYNTILSKISSLKANGGTPTTRRYYEVSQIVRNENKYRCDKNFIVVLSDGDANGSQVAENWVYNYRYGNYSPTGVTPYWANNTLTDSYFGSRRGGTYGYKATLLSTGGLSVDLWDTIWDRNDGMGWFSKTLASKRFDHSSSVDGFGKAWTDGGYNQVAETYTVGFGEGLSDAGREYLKQGASSENNYFDARDDESLVNAFKRIFSSIESNSQSLAETTTANTAPAVTSSGISDMAANVQLDPKTWSSRLQFYQVNSDGTVNTDASTIKYPYFSERKTLINTDGKSVYWANDYTQYGNNSFFKISGTKTDEWKLALVPWLIRDGADDSLLTSTYTSANGYSQNYRKRIASPADKETRNLGDIVDAPVLTVGGGSSDGLLNGRNEFMVTAANDGMVHLFQSKDSTNPYSLKLSYIPAAMERGGTSYGGRNVAQTLKEVAHEKYGEASNPHRYLINGGIVVRRTASDEDVVKGQQAFMFGAMGQGARGAYALNIGGKDRVTGADIGLNAASSSWQSQVPLFETEKGINNSLGYTVSTPQIGRVALVRSDTGTINTETDVRYAGFLANGYGESKFGTIENGVSSASTETSLYVYDMLGQNAYNGQVGGAAAGSVIHKFTITENNSGLSSPTLVDTNFDGVVDVAYAGDYAGNMYRFDMRATSTSGWTVKKIFSGSTTRPITSAPAISRRANNKYVVIFGTGSDIYQDDVTDKSRQAVYGIYDDLTDENPVAATDTDLQEQTLSEVTTGYRAITSDNTIQDAQKGWMVQLGETDGERVVVKPTIILRTVVLSTRIYDRKEEKTNSDTADLCSVNSEKVETNTSSWILNLNAQTGGKLKSTDARLQFIQQNVGSTEAYYAGQKQSGITSFTFMDGSKLDDSPVTKDGDSGGSGTDKALNAGVSSIPSNKCFSRKATRTVLTNQNASFNVEGRVCNLKRLSWREIFF